LVQAAVLFYKNIDANGRLLTDAAQRPSSPENMGNETMIEATETLNVIEPKTAAPCFQVKRLVSVRCREFAGWFTCLIGFHLIFEHHHTVDGLRGFRCSRCKRSVPEWG